MIFIFLSRCIIALAMFLAVSTIRADWMNLSGAENSPNIAEIYVTDDHIKLVLEIYPDHLKYFEDLVPGEWLFEGELKVPPIAQKKPPFSRRGFQFVTGTGEKLKAQLIRAEPRLRIDRNSPFAGMINPITRLPVPGAPANKNVLYVELNYPYSEKPHQITMVPPLDNDGEVPVNIGFIVYHKAVPVIDFRYLGGPELLTLNWGDPWYSQFTNRNLKRHHKSALMSFLYVEPYEVRHEILTRVKDLEAWIDLGLRGDEFIEIDELEPLKQRIGAFMLGKNPVFVDGEALKPILDQINYIKLAVTGIQVIEKPVRTEIATANIGVIITYMTKGMPGEVKMKWELFTDQLKRVPATATDPAGPLPTFLTPDDNVHTWTNFLKKYQIPTVKTIVVEGTLGSFRVPWVSAVCILFAFPLLFWLVRSKKQGQGVIAPIASLAGIMLVGIIAYPVHITIKRTEAIAGELKPDQARHLLHTLLKNVYRAFDFRNEEDVYDKLAISVSGDLLADIYLQNRRSLSIQQAGGAQAKIRSVMIEDAKAEYLGGQPLTYAIKGAWNALGTIGHWGHVHIRHNHYEAVVTVKAVDGGWKITDLEVLNEQRINPNFISVSDRANTAKREDTLESR